MRNSKWLVFMAMSCVLACTGGEGDIDFCPDDQNKIVPGICGCGVPDTDTNGNGIIDCLEVDLCPNDPNKTLPGICGCGIPDVDEDGNGIIDCLESDQCPDDPDKTLPGICGCGVKDIIDETTGLPGCDQCPDDPDKILPGICGCGVPDTIDEATGLPFCLDQCPDDPLKLLPGICGCGVPDTDTDGDGVPDCFDQCPNDPDKIFPGICGCGAPDIRVVDADGNTVVVCIDMCPEDPDKLAPGVCGCGVPDTADNVRDDDGDGVPNCLDACPNNPTKWSDPGAGGCDVLDSDGDGVDDSEDACPYNPNIQTADQGDCNIVTEDGLNVFQIWSAYDLLTLKQALENTSKPIAKAVVMRDINLAILNTTVITGSSSCHGTWVPFALTNIELNGQNHTIRFQHAHTRCRLNNALFSQITSSSVKNLTLNYDLQGTPTSTLAAQVSASELQNIRYLGTFITTSSASVGGIVVTSTNNSKLTNIHFGGDILAPHAATVGGIAATATGGTYEQIHTRITSAIGSGTVGGAFGTLTNATVSDANNQVGRIQSTNSGTTGGFAASAQNTTLTKIRNSVGTASGGFIGGAFGDLINATISYVDNQVDSVHSTNSNYAGGFAARAQTTTITQVRSVVNTVNSGTYAGGFIGDCRGTSVSGTPAISFIQNRAGTVLGTSYVAGLCGYSNNLYFSDIDNSVDVVKGNSYVGGLLGYVPSSIRIERTINTVNSIGPNTASAVSYAGGFAGLCGSSTSSCSAEMIKNRIGKIQGNTVGGMFGESPITIIRNTDSIIDDMQANSFAAGLIGYASRKIVFENINSTANITASSMYTGGLVGALQVFEIEAIVRQTSSTAVIRASSFSYLAGLFGYTDVFVTSNPGLMFHNVYTSAMLLNSSGSPVPNPRMYLNLNSSSSSWPFAASNAFWQRHGDNDVATPNSTYNGYFTEAGPLEKVRDDLTSAMSAGDRSWEITKTDLFDTINEVVTLKPLALEISFEPLDF